MAYNKYIVHNNAERLHNKSVNLGNPKKLNKKDNAPITSANISNKHFIYFCNKLLLYIDFGHASRSLVTGNNQLGLVISG